MNALLVTVSQFAKELKICSFSSTLIKYYRINSLPNNKIPDWSKLKAFADDNLNVVKMTISLFDRLEKTVGKGENAGYQHFLLFPVFFKAFYLGSFKVGILW